ncbi:hypothetical protein EAF00_007474 [Botryotinia globosa]|nr:hypothetical protein EAF00_007474 [Botryotinia globosa]
MSEVKEKGLGSDILPTDVTSTDGSTTSPSSHQNANIEVPLRSWEKPGFKGSICRFFRSVQSYVWDDPDKPAIEKWFLLKLDFFLLTYGCRGYFCKNLDQANVNNAYVSGMQEAINMKGSQLTYMGNVFTAGYVTSQIPAVILVTHVRPSILIPTLGVLWSIFRFCSAAVTNLMNSSGHLGHAGWQWLFIICGTISLPVGVIEYFFNPDFPETTRAFYLTKAEIELAKERLVSDGYNPLGSSAWDKKKLFRMMAQWQFWVLPFGYFFIQASLPSQQPAFALWLKAKDNSVYDRDVLPTAQAGIGVIVQVVTAMISDSNLLHGTRWPPILVMQLGTFFSAVVLAMWSVPIKLKFVAFILHISQPIWYSDAVWRTEEGPAFRPGWIAAATFGAATALTALLTRFLERRDERKGIGAFGARLNDLENSRGGGSIETSQ